MVFFHFCVPATKLSRWFSGMNIRFAIGRLDSIPESNHNGILKFAGQLGCSVRLNLFSVDFLSRFYYMKFDCVTTTGLLVFPTICLSHKGGDNPLSGIPKNTTR